MRYQCGSAGTMLLAFLVIGGTISFSFMTESVKESGHINKAMDLAATEEAKSLRLLDEASHKWLDVEYNRQRIWEYGTRYEIPMNELIANNWLPTDFANRYTAEGESVYGLTYTSSVIRRDLGSGNEEFNVLTTIGERGTFPPLTPPLMCPVLYDHLNSSGDSNIGGPRALENSTNFIPYNGSCSSISANDTRSWLLVQSNWDTLTNAPTPFKPPSANFTCTKVTNQIHALYTLAEDSVYPKSIDGFINCRLAEESIPPNTCPMFFTWTIDGVPVHYSGPIFWNNLHMKSYGGSCSNTLVGISETDLRNDVALNYSTAGTPFGAGDPTCSNAGDRINCIFAETGGVNPPGDDSECRVYVWDILTSSYVLQNTYTGPNCYGNVP